MDSIRIVLSKYDPKKVTVVHGDAPGADSTVGEVANQMGFKVERQRADWSGPCKDSCRPDHRRSWPSGDSYCPAAGVFRNQRMLDLGADEVVGFPGKTGTTDMLQRAEDARVPWRSIGWNPAIRKASQ